MIDLFYGDDDFTVRRHVAEALRASPDATGFGVSTLDAETAAWGAIVAASQTLPFFSVTQTVIVRNLLTVSSRRRASSGDDLSRPGVSPDGLMSLLMDLPDSTHLILQDGGLAPANAHLKRLQQSPRPVTIRECLPPIGDARTRWIQQEVRQRGGLIEAGAASFLATRLPASLWSVSNAIDMLLSFAGPGGTISAENVSSMVQADEGDNVFQFTDAIAAKRVDSSLGYLEQLLAHGMAEEQILSIVTGRIRDWTLVAALRSEDVQEADAVKRLGWNPSKYRAVSRGGSQFARGELPRAFQALVICDEALKSRPADERHLILDALVLVLTTRGDAESLRRLFPTPVV